MNAIPIELKRAISVGIGLFILFIGLVNGGLVDAPGACRWLAALTTHPTVPDRRDGLRLLVTLLLLARRWGDADSSGSSPRPSSRSW